MIRRFISVLVMAALLVTPSYAEELLPDIPKATGEPHPEGNEYWRINHPTLLRHDRDLTVIDGIRDVNASLAQCVACHAVKGPDSAPVTYESPEYFCRVCHDFAAVQINCFECHKSVPDSDELTGLLPLSPPDEMATLQAYIDGAGQ